MNYTKRIMLGVAGLLVAAATSFGASPVTVDGLSLWLDAGDLVANGEAAENGAAVTYWKDKASGIEFYQNDAGRAPSYATGVVNGLPVVHFERIDARTARFLQADNAMIAALFNNPNTAFVVARATSGSGDAGTQLSSYIFSRTGYHSGLTFNGCPTTTEIGYTRWLLGHTGPLGVARPVTQGEFAVIEDVVTGTSSSGPSSLSLRVNGGEYATANDAQMLGDHVNDGSSQMLRLGCAFTDNADYVGGLTGDIAEILVFNRQLSAAESEVVGSYLQAKYGIAGGYPMFVVANPVTGGLAYTASGSVVVGGFPVVSSATEYQITVGADSEPADGAWKPYTPGMTPSETIGFTAESGDEVTFRAWLRAGVGSEVQGFSDSIVYRPELPTVAVRDATLMLGADGTRKLVPAEIDNGCMDDLGIASMTVAPDTISAVGETQVTLTVVNIAGASASAVATVTAIPYVKSEVGVGGESWPLGAGWITRMLHLGSDFDNHYLDRNLCGAIGNDQLADFGSETNQHPVAGLVYDGVPGATSSDGSLVWTDMSIDAANGQWIPQPDRDNYIKYWHFYVNVPGDEDIDVSFRHCNDDGLYVWVNGVRQIAHGGAGGEYTTLGKLRAGVNSITVKLEEFGGGDYMALRITDAAGRAIPGLELRMQPSLFEVANPVSGSVDFTSGTELAVAGYPDIAAGSQYQFTATDDPASLDDSAWADFDVLNPPSRIAVSGEPVEGGTISVACWTRVWKSGTLVTNVATDTISYTEVAPTAVARDVTLALDPATGARKLLASDVDFGSHDAVSGIYSMSVSPEAIGEGANSVTFTVINNAGLSDSTTVTVTGVRPAGESMYGAEPDLPVTDGINFWYRGKYLDDIGYADGATVPAMQDDSGNGHHSWVWDQRAPTIAKKVLNGHTAYRYNGGVGMCNHNNFGHAGEMTFFFVAKGESYNSIIRWQDGNGYTIYPWGENEYMISNTNGGTEPGDNAGLETGLVKGEWNIASAVIDIGVPDGVRTYRDGALVDTATWNNPLGIANRFMTCTYELQGDYAECDVPEVIVYDRALSDEERIAVQDYLAAKYALPAGFEVADPVTGSRAFTSSTTVDVTGYPDIPAGIDVQVATSGDPASLDPAAWTYFDASAAPALTASFASLEPASGDTVIFYLWTRTFDPATGAPVYASYSTTIQYVTSAPTAAAKDISIAIDAVGGTEITPEMIDDGSADAACGIASMTVTPAIVRGTTQVTLTVVNKAGVSATAIATVTAAGALDAHVSTNGDDIDGDGTAAKPWRTVTYAIASAPAGATIYVAPGTYDCDGGEAFPIIYADDILRPEPGIEGDVVIDGQNNTDLLFTISGQGATFDAEGITFRNSRGAAFYIDRGRMNFVDCHFRQSAEWYAWYWDGAVSADNGSDLAFKDCTFVGMKRHSVIRNRGYAPATTLDGCLFEGNTNIFATIAMDGSQAAHAMMRDCRFVRNWANDSFPHDGAYSAIIYITGDGNNPFFMDIDRCTFLGNDGGDLFGVGYPGDNTARIRNSLFVDNIGHEGEFHGYTAGKFVSIENCTFIGGTGGFSNRGVTTRISNSIIARNGRLSFTSPLDGGRTGNPAGLTLVNTLVWDTGLGEGYNTVNSANVTFDVDPILENIEADFDDPAFDARPRPYSPAIDAGDEFYVSTDTDHDGNARVRDNDGDNSAAVDLGCYESLFHASPAPAFTVPFDGRIAGFRRVSYEIPVGISPFAGSDAVTANVAYGDGLEGDATLSFASGSDTATLHFRVLDSANTFARITISDAADPAAIRPAVYDVFMDDLVVTVGGDHRRFISQGDTIDIPVSLALAGAVAPADVAITDVAVSGDGTSSIAWAGGEQVILKGSSVSDGVLRVTAGLGVNSATLTAGATFAETGSDSVTLAFVGYPGWLAVDPENGDDETGTGTVENPLKTIGFAASLLKPGEEVRLLPGTYSPSTETFPLQPGDVKLVGWNPSGDTDRAAHVITGGDEVGRVLYYLNGESSSVENVAIRDTADSAVRLDGAEVTFKNVLFTQATTNYNAGGAIQLQDNAVATAEDCAFDGISRVAAVVGVYGALNNADVFNARRCRFEDIDSNWGLGISMVSGLGTPTVYFDYQDCVFTNCTSLGQYLSDAYAGAIAYLRAGGKVTADRCEFLDCDGGSLMTICYGGAEIDNSLIAGCDNNAGLFDGSGSPTAYIRNCTVTGCSGGFNCFDVTCVIYNSILAGNGAISFVRWDLGGRTDVAWHSSKPVYLTDTIVWNTPDGVQDFTGTKTNVIEKDPLLRGALSYDPETEADVSKLDAHLRSGSPALDAGDNANVLGDYDLAGAPRIRVALPGTETATVDLGCYESDKVSFGTVLMLK